MDSKPITLEILTCYDCPRFQSLPQYAPNRFPYFGEFRGYKYYCTQEEKEIVSGTDSVDPPPSWCPKRDDETRNKLLQQEKEKRRERDRQLAEDIFPEGWEKRLNLKE